MKKVFALVLALAMIFAMAIPAMAAGASVTVNHIANNHAFMAFQLITGNMDDEGKIGNPVWGSGVKGDALLAALKADTEVIYNSDKTQSAQFSVLFKDAANAEDVVNILKDFSTDGDRLEHFAEIASKHLVADKGVASATAVPQSDGSYNYVISGLEPGYYMIVDVTDDDGNAGTVVGDKDYKTRYILSLSTHANLFTKGDFSTVTKGVSEALDATYNEYITQQMNTTHYFKWNVALDDDLREYDAYYLEFQDTMSDGLTFLKYEEIYFQEVGGHKEYLYKNNAWVSDAAKAKINTVNVNADNTTSIVLAWDDLKTAYADVAGDDELVVKYSAKLNERAIAGQPEENEVKIVFSNGPESDDRGISLPDDAFVFPFGMKVKKVDSNDETKLLAGAEFLLYHLHGTEKHYAVVNSAGQAMEWTTYTPETAKAAWDAIDADTSLNDTQKAEAKAKILAPSVLVTDANGHVQVDGLNADVNYFLHETKAPAGYNQMFTDVRFSIHPTIAMGTGGVPYVVSVAYHVDGTDGHIDGYDAITVTVKNDQGNVLPSTGGVGTTLFYVVGGLLFAGAAVLLITKKRMSY